MCRRLLIPIVALATFVALPSHAATQRAPILDGSVAVQADGYEVYTVKVDATSMPEARIVGHLTASGGTGNDIDVDVFTESDFLNWKNSHDTHPLFASGHVTATDLDVPVERSGVYYVVLSNNFSLMTPKTVEGRIALVWTTPAPASPFKDEQDATKTIVWTGVAIIVCIFLVAAGVGGLIVWAVMSRRKKAQTPASGS